VYQQPAPLDADATKEQKDAFEKELAIYQASKQVITVKEGKDTKSLTPIAVVWRNGVAAPLYDTDVARAKKGSDKEGWAYPAPHVQWAKENSDKFLQWIGVPVVVRWAASKVKQIAQSLAEEACDDLRNQDGNIVHYMVKGKPSDDAKPDYTTFDLGAFLELMADLSPRSETLSEINEAIMTLVEEMSNLDLDEYQKKFGDVEGAVRFKQDFSNLRSQAASYKQAKDKKKRHKTTTSLEDGSVSGDTAVGAVEQTA
jgi:hypothetical protein